MEKEAFTMRRDREMASGERKHGPRHKTTLPEERSPIPASPGTSGTQMKPDWILPVLPTPREQDEPLILTLLNSCPWGCLHWATKF